MARTTHVVRGCRIGMLALAVLAGGAQPALAVFPADTPAAGGAAKAPRTAAAAPASAAAAPAIAAALIEHLGVPGPILFQGVAYQHVYSHHQGTLTAQEYLPAGQTLERFDSMLTVSDRTEDVTVVDVAKAKVAELDARKGVDPVVNHAMILSEDGRGVLLDFLLSAPDAQGRPIVEWNAYRYAPRAGGTGVRVVAITRRAYGDAVLPFLRDALKPIRARDVDALAALVVGEAGPAASPSRKPATTRSPVRADPRPAPTR